MKTRTNLHIRPRYSMRKTVTEVEIKGPVVPPVIYAPANDVRVRSSTGGPCNDVWEQVRQRIVARGWRKSTGLRRSSWRDKLNLALEAMNVSDPSLHFTSDDDSSVAEGEHYNRPALPAPSSTPKCATPKKLLRTSVTPALSKIRKPKPSTQPSVEKLRASSVGRHSLPQFFNYEESPYMSPLEPFENVTLANYKKNRSTIASYRSFYSGRQSIADTIEVEEEASSSKVATELIDEVLTESEAELSNDDTASTPASPILRPPEPMAKPKANVQEATSSSKVATELIDEVLTESEPELSNNSVRTTTITPASPILRLPEPMAKPKANVQEEASSSKVATELIDEVLTEPEAELSNDDTTITPASPILRPPEPMAKPKAVRKRGPRVTKPVPVFEVSILEKTIHPIVPDVDEDCSLRRSKRTRMPRLEIWRNQRPKYEKNEEGTYDVVAITKGSLLGKTSKRPRKPNSHPNKKIRSNEGKEGGEDGRLRVMRNLLDLSIHAMDMDDVMKENDKRLKQRNNEELINLSSELEWKESGVSGTGVKMAIVKKDKERGEAHGLLKLEPMAEKIPQKTGDYITYFTVMSGVVSIQIDDNPVVILKTLSSFDVMKNTNYSIRNLRYDVAYLGFHVAKNR